MNVRNSKIRVLNLKWTIAALIIVILCLVAYIITFCFDEENCNRSINCLSVFSVLLSIVLSIFAILYTYTSNIEINRQFEKIVAVRNAINKSSEKLSSTNDMLNGNIGEIIDRLKNIDKTQEAIRSSVDNLKVRTTIENLESQFNNTN